MMPQYRMVFHGEYDYQMYLAERVTRQHSPDFLIRASDDPPQFMRHLELMDAETITLLQARIFFNHFLRGPEITYKQHITGHLMPRRPPVLVETMCAMALPRGYVPLPAAQLDMTSPPQPTVSPEHDVAPDDNDDDQQGADNFEGFDFGDAEQPPPYHPFPTSTI